MKFIPKDAGLTKQEIFVILSEAADMELDIEDIGFKASDIQDAEAQAFVDVEHQLRGEAFDEGEFVAERSMFCIDEMIPQIRKRLGLEELTPGWDD